MAGTVKESLKEKIDRLRRKIKRKKAVGNPDIPGVDKPKDKPSHAKEKAPERKDPKKDKTVAVGPKGGKFSVSSGGKKQYERGKVAKSMIEEIVREDELRDFIKSYKMSKK